MITDRFPRLKGLVLDMDGVLWRENEAIGDLPQIFDTIRKLGLSFVLATNNSTRSVKEYLEKLAGFGVQVDPNQILSSALASLTFCKRSLPQNAKVFVIGSTSLSTLFADSGFQTLQIDEPYQADAVIVGLDRSFNYGKLRFASQLIRSGAKFIATNSDATFPVPGGQVPGAGAIVKAVEVACGEKPILIGKPEKYLFNQALCMMGTKAEETLAVGDRIETDIQGAINAGLLCALVLSGVTNDTIAKTIRTDVDLIANDLWEILND